MWHGGAGGPKEGRRRYWTRDEKRRIVVESLEDGASAADVAWRHDLNAALLFTWRRQLGLEPHEPKKIVPILPVTIVSEAAVSDAFQPSFKLAEKSRDGAKVTKRYHAPATPHQRLISDARTTAATRERVAAIYDTLDPVHLLNAIRTCQRQLVEIADRPLCGEKLAPTAPTLEEFLSGLRTAWREGEVRPTSKPKDKPKRGRRRPDPLLVVTAQLRDWFETEPWRPVSSQDIIQQD